MKKIFTFSMAALCLAATSTFAQTLSTVDNNTCNNTNFAEYQNFNDGTTGTAGFSGAGWTKFIQGNSQYLVVTTNPSLSYSLTTPAYTFAGGTISVRFTISGNSSLSSFSLSALTPTNTTIPITGSITSPTATMCLSITGLNAYAGVPLRFVLQFTTTSGNGFDKLISFDDFFITALSAAQTPLPVQFTSFETKATKEGAVLNWNVGTEENIKGYEVQKSLDQKNFSPIGFVAATAQRAYTYIDANPSTIVYYRIKSVNVDGKTGYSTIVNLKNGKSSVLLKAFPMPVQNELTIQHGTASPVSQIAISSMDGRLIQTIIPLAGSQQTTLNLSKTRAGLYLVRFENGNGETETLKVIKQ